MSFQFEKGFVCRRVEMEALSNVSFSIKGAHRDREKGMRKVWGGTREGVVECQLMA